MISELITVLAELGGSFLLPKINASNVYFIETVSLSGPHWP